MKNIAIVFIIALVCLVGSLLCIAGTQAPPTLSWNFAAQNAVGATSDMACFPNGYPSRHTVSLVVTGTPATCTYSLMSCDNAGCYDISGPQACTASVQFSVDQRPARCIEGYVDTLTGGSSPTVQMNYTGALR